MLEEFQIWIDRLRDGKRERIASSFAPAFLEVEEKELQFREPVRVEGEVYIAQEHVILHFTVSTKATVPCAICNEMVGVAVEIPYFYHAEPLEKIKGALFTFSPLLREAILLEVPQYSECCSGKCPERISLAQYLRSAPQTNEETHSPFSEL